MLRILFSLHLVLLLCAGSSFASDIDSYPLFSYSFAPKTPCDIELNYTYYQLCYSPAHRIAKWTKHELTKAQVLGSEPRTSDFRADFRVPNPVSEFDYSHSGFNRGHLVPAADMRQNLQAMSETFYMTNMTPQDPGFNSGVWNALEAHVRREVLRLGPAVIITAPVLSDAIRYSMIRSNVTIPDRFYKIIYFPESQTMQAYLVPNKHAQGLSFRNFQTTVRQIETLTGFDFFHELSDELEAILETTF